MRVVDNCSVPNKDYDYNPSNVKAGGSRRVGVFTYRIEPVKEQPYDYNNIVMGKCRCDMLNWHIDCYMWGRGWARGDKGRGLRDNAVYGGCQTVESPRPLIDPRMIQLTSLVGEHPVEVYSY